MKSSDYLALMNENVIPWMAEKFPDGKYHYLQDNCSVHKAKVVMDNFNQKNISLLDWPARSPDLNIIENWWFMLSDKVYEFGSFDSDDDLWEKIKLAADWIQVNKPEYFKNLFDSMGGRLLKVIDKKGGIIDY